MAGPVRPSRHGPACAARPVRPNPNVSRDRFTCCSAYGTVGLMFLTTKKTRTITKKPWGGALEDFAR